MGELQVVSRIEIVEVTRPGALADAVRDLFLEYGETLGFNTCFAGLDEELTTLPGEYVPPRGCLLLAREGGAAAGYRRIYLDSLPTMLEARALYAALGFTACAPYYDNSLLGSDCYELVLDQVPRPHSPQ
ncbi:MAG TPA: hypothetical protein VLD15_03575 [Burkholderiales bacterium]|nr:hypothetical protein [Burkholderiales bacterium]